MRPDSHKSGANNVGQISFWREHELYANPIVILVQVLIAFDGHKSFSITTIEIIICYLLTNFHPQIFHHTTPFARHLPNGLRYWLCRASISQSSHIPLLRATDSPQTEHIGKVQCTLCSAAFSHAMNSATLSLLMLIWQSLV